MGHEAAALVRGYAKAEGLSVTVRFFDELDDGPGEHRNGFVCECEPTTIWIRTGVLNSGRWQKQACMSCSTFASFGEATRQ
jgi:hypothetical protein